MQSLVYFIEDPITNAVKIGYSSSLSSRLRALKGMYRNPLLRVVGVLPGGRDLEEELHARFSDLNDGGEWFSLTPSLREFIDKQTFKLANDTPVSVLSKNGFYLYLTDSIRASVAEIAVRQGQTADTYSVTMMIQTALEQYASLLRQQE